MKHEGKTNQKIESPVYINVADCSEVLSPYAEDNNRVINNNFANFLDNAVKDVPVKHSLRMEISLPGCKTEIISKAIKNYYSNELLETKHKLKQNIISSFITLFIGLTALLTSIILSKIGFITIVYKFFEILAWVFVWESAHLFFFKRTELVYTKHRQENFVNAKIISNEKE